MSIQVSTFDTKTRKRDKRFLFEENQIFEIAEKQASLEIEILDNPFSIVLTEYV